jgi:hypothetical protein
MGVHIDSYCHYFKGLLSIAVIHSLCLKVYITGSFIIVVYVCIPPCQKQIDLYLISVVATR